MQYLGTFGTVHLHPDILKSSELFVQKTEKVNTQQSAPAQCLFAPHIRPIYCQQAKSVVHEWKAAHKSIGFKKRDCK